MDSARKPTDVNDKAAHKFEAPTPWVSASELQPVQRQQADRSLDEVDEALMESFPCSDPPCYTHTHV